MKLAHTLLALSLTAPLALLVRADAGAADGNALPTSASADQATTSKLVYGWLSDSRYAYRPRALDDALSQDVFTRYLEGLDPGKVFLTAQDVAKFASHKTRLDDAIKSGEFEAPYAMFALYKQRVGERVAFARDLLKKDMFDFSGTDRWNYDREDAPWAADAAALDAQWKQSVRNDWLRLKLAGKQPEDIRKTLDKRYDNLQDSIAEPQRRGRVPDLRQCVCRFHRSAHRLFQPAQRRAFQPEHDAVAGRHRRGAAEAGRCGGDSRNRPGRSGREQQQAQAGRSRGRRRPGR